MANVNAQAIAFSNNRIRPMADLLYSTYLSAKKLLQEWNSQSVATVIPNDSTIIGDGSAVDGRPQITDANATSIVTRCQDIVNLMEGSVAIATNDGSKAVLNTVTVAEVNGKSTF